MNFSIGALQMGLPVTHAPPEPPLLLQLVLSYLTWLPKADSQRRRPYYDGSGSGGYGREWNQPGGPSDDEDEGDYFGSGNGSGDTVFITPVTKTGEAEAGGRCCSCGRARTLRGEPAGGVGQMSQRAPHHCFALMNERSRSVVVHAVRIIASLYLFILCLKEDKQCVTSS